MSAFAGTAHVKIEPDLSGFKEELKAKLGPAVGSAKVQVNLTLDRASAARVDAEARAQTRPITRKVKLEHDHNSFQAAEKAFGGVEKRVGGLGGALKGLYGGAAKITAVGLGSQAVSALGAAAVTTTAALTPLAGLLAAYPAVASAGAQAVGVWKLAFSGVSTAVGGLNNEINKNSQAWKSLTPEGKKFAEQLQAMKTPLRELSAESQKGLMPGLQTGMKSAMTNFPILRKQVGETAKVMGGLATEAGKLIGSKGFGRDLDTQMGRNQVTIRRLGEAGLYLGDGMRHIVIAAGPLVDWLTKTALAGAKNVDQWAAAGRKSGEFAKFFVETKHVMTDVGHIAGDLGVGLFNIFRLAYPEGKSFLDVQVKLADKFKDWTKSAEGQNRIKQFFHDARPAMDEAEKLIGTLLADFGKLGQGTQVAPLLHTLRVELLPKLYEMVDATTKSFGPPFIHALTIGVDLFTQLGGTSGPLVSSVKLFGEMAGGVNWLLKNIPGLKPIIMAIAVAGGINKALGISSAIGGLVRMQRELKIIAALNAASGAAGGGVPGGAKGAAVVSGGGMLGGGGLMGMFGKGAAGEAETAGKGILSKLGPVLSTGMKGLGIAGGAFFVADMASQIITGKGIFPALASLFGGHHRDYDAAAHNFIKGFGDGMRRQGGIDPWQYMTPDTRGLERAYRHAASVATDAWKGAQPKYGYNALGQWMLLKPGDVTKAAAAVKTAARNIFGGWDLEVKSTKHWDFSHLAASVTHTLAGLPKPIQAATAASMVAAARQMQRDGRLPVGAAERLARQIEAKYGIIIPGLGDVATKSQKAVSDAFRRSDAVRAGQSVINRIKGSWGNAGLPQLTGKTAHNMSHNYLTEMEFLVKQSHSKNKQIAADAKTDLHEVVKSATNYAIATKDGWLLNQVEMINSSDKHYKDLRSRVRGHLKGMTSDATSSTSDIRTQLVSKTGANILASVGIFGGFASHVQGAVKSGAMNTTQAADIIGSAVNRQLQAFGQKPIPGLVSAGAARAWKDWWTGQHAQDVMRATTLPVPGTGGGRPAGAARGALIPIGRPGFPGHDAIPMSVGGTDIVVGEGETAAVFTRHQKAELDMRLAREGGLGGWFSKRTRPNYMASGGIVAASMYGGPSDPTVSQSNPQGYRGDNLLQHPDSFAELDMGHALGTLPYLAPVNVTYHGRTARLRKRDIGRGGPGIGGHPRAIDLWYQAAQQLGFGGLDLVTVNGGAGVNVVIGGGGGSVIPHLTGIKIPGAGTMHTLVQQGANKMIGGANAYIDAHQPVATGGGGGPFFPVAPGPVPPQVQIALQAAQNIAARHPAYGHLGAGWGLPAYDCSSYVSTVMDAAGIWPKWTYYTAAGPINQATDPGPGKWITIGTWGSSGQNAHTMMEIDGKFFESGGGGGGPHQDSGWSMKFDQYRHPKGFARGGLVGDRPGQPGYQPTQDEAQRIQRNQHNLLRGYGGRKRFAGGGIVSGGAGLRPKHTGKPTPKGTGKPIPKSWLHWPSFTLRKPPSLRKAGSALLHAGHLNKPPKGHGQQRFWIDGPMPFEVTDWHVLNNAAAQVFAWDGSLGGSSGEGDAEKQAKLIDWKTTLYSSALYPPPNFSSWQSPPDFVISQDAAGNAVPPYISTHINDVVKQLSEITGYQATWVTDLHNAADASRAMLPTIEAAIKRRRDKLAAIKHRVKANVAEIKRLRAQIDAENRKQRPYPHPKGKAQHNANAAFDKARKDKLKSLNKRIADLHTENQRLVGAPDQVPGTLGGEAAAISAQLGDSGSGGALGSILGSGTSASGLHQLAESANSWVSQLIGTGGDIDQQNLQLQTYLTGGRELEKGANVALQAAIASASPGVAPPDQFAAQLQQWAQERSGLGALEGMVLSRYGGSFDKGGTVPGPVGAPILITAHGGEEVLSREDRAQGGHTFEIHGDPHTVAVLEQMIEKVNVRSNRGQARSADRRMRLPGNAVR